jgi:hypothetical protein
MPFVSWFLLLLTREWCTGGGSNVVTVMTLFSTAGVGRLGVAGVGSSCSGQLLLPLLGGVLNGEDLSVERGGPGSSVVASVRDVRAISLLAILGFSARLTGGGALKEVSRRSSPDLLGGGGDGGVEAESLGDFLGSRRGVPGLLGILKFLGEEVPETADKGVSVDR